MAEVKPFPRGDGEKEGPNRSQVAAILKSLLEEICDIKKETITEATSVDDELRMESVHLAKLQVAVEEELDISVDFLEIFRLKTFGRIVDYVHGLKSA